MKVNAKLSFEIFAMHPSFISYFSNVFYAFIAIDL